MPALSPMQREWIDSVLVPLAERAAAAEDPRTLADELLAEVWPWATVAARRLAAQLPPWADRDDARGAVLAAVWQATRSIDWARATTWPALLRNRMHGALVDAARAADPLSRRLRSARHELDAAVGDTEQATSRPLGMTEVADLARKLFPTARPTWLAVVLSDDAAAPITGRQDRDPVPEELVEQAQTCAAVQRWLRRLPSSLAEDLLGWATGGSREVLPVRLARRVRPHVADLRDALAA